MVSSGEIDYGWMLTPAEQAVLAGETNRKRAQAVQATIRLAELWGLGLEVTERQVERVRSLDKAQAKRFRKLTGELLAILGAGQDLEGGVDRSTLDIREQTPQDNSSETASADIPVITEVTRQPLAPEETLVDGVSTPVIATVQPLSQDLVSEEDRYPLVGADDTEPEVTTPYPDIQTDESHAPHDLSELDAIEDIPTAIERARLMMRQVLGEYEEELNDHIIARREKFLDDIFEVNTTALDLSDEYLANLLSTYVQSASKPLMSVRIVNAACTWAYLRGAPIEEIRYLRNLTKPGATRQDIYNSVSAVKSGVIAAKKRAVKQIPVDTDAHTVAEQPDMDDVLKPSAGQVVTTEDAIVEQASAPNIESSYANEPKHIQLANGLLQALNLGEDYRAAMEGLLNPDANVHQLSDNKMTIIETLQNIVRRERSAGRDIYGELAKTMALGGKDEVTVKSARSRLNMFIGVFIETGGRETNRPPQTIAKQSASRISEIDKGRFVGFFNLGIEALIEIIEKRKAAEAEKQEFTFS